jgi:hypothetical protein
MQMKRHESLVRQHQGSRESAIAILGELIERRKKITLLIQQEMVENRKPLNETAAGQQLDQDILRERAKHKEEMEEWKQKMDEAIKKRDFVAKAHIEEMQRGLQIKMEEAKQARESMRADFKKLHKECEEEMNKMKNRINEQVCELQESSRRREELQAKLDAGQSNLMISKQLHDYEQKIHSLEAKLDSQITMMERRKGGKFSLQEPTRVRLMLMFVPGLSSEVSKWSAHPSSHPPAYTDMFSLAKIVFGALLPWPISVGYQLANMNLKDKSRA